MRNFKEEFELFNISEKLKQEFKCFETSLENSKKNREKLFIRNFNYKR